MARDLDSAMAAGLASGDIVPVILAMLQFRSQTEYVWTGVGNLVWNAQTYKGIGTLGSVGTISEGVDVQARGTSVTLSGIDPALLAESLTDVRVGAAARIYFGLMGASGTALMGAPYVAFAGQIDAPQIAICPPTEDAPQGTVSITLPIESKMINHARAACRRYTSADQHDEYPDDTAFNWVEILSDLALKQGT